MGDFLGPILFLVVVFVGFGLAHGNRRTGSCGDCSGDCDEGSCERT